MNGNGGSSGIGVEGASNGINDGVVAQADGPIADAASSSPESGANKGPCPAFLKFLKRDLAVDQLMQYLKLEEMKVLCLVSKDMLAVVMRTEEFAKRSHFDIKKELDTSEVDDLHTRFPFSWKHMAFDVSLPMRVVNQFADKLKCVESLRLYYKSTRCLFAREELSLSSVVECCIRMHAILSMANNLRELQLDPFLLDYPLHETLSNCDVQQSMSKLESLIVDNLERSCHHSAQFQQNLLQLARCPFTKIKKFFMEYCIDKPDELDCIVEIVQAFKETLEVLPLKQRVWQLEKMMGIRCPKLRHLNVVISETDLEGVAAFAEQQPLLEELILDIHTGEPDKDLKCFPGRLLNIRKFSYNFEQTEIAELEEVDWTFLEAMTKLEEITVKLPFDGRGPELIDSLPESVKKLNLECHHRDHAFWYNLGQGSSPNFGDHLRRLKNLTHLSLIDCYDAVDDAGLQTIIKTLPNLVELRLGNCTKLTDFGISGVNGNETVNEREAGVPLSHLKGIGELEISHCDLVTTACILMVVRFQFLGSFTFNTSKENKIQDKAQFASQMRERNPRLFSLKHNGHALVKNGLVWTNEDEEEAEDEQEDEVVEEGEVTN